MKVKSTDAETALAGLTPAADATTARVSTPTSTGGAGTAFEQHVGAYWLAQLLVGAIPPILIGTTVAEVRFQTERLGWHTDDFLVVCTIGGEPRNLAGQVKRSFTVSEANKECEKAITDFWRDFNAPHFSKDHDRLALVTLRGTNTLLEHFVGLLDCARAARDGAEFEQRLAAGGFISGTAVRYCGELQKILAHVAGKSVTRPDIWPFLRALHVLSLDLHSSTRQTEAHIKSMLALTVTGGDPVASAAASWHELVGIASTAMVGSRSLRRDDLPTATLVRHGVIGTSERRVLRALADHTAPVLRAIRSTLGDKLHLPRAALVQKILDALESAQVVLVAGPAGSGKSVAGKEAVDVLALNHFRFGFRVEEFVQAHFDATLTAAQVPANWATLRAILGAQDRKVVLIESVERLLEKTTRDAFTDLMTLAADDRGLRIVLTCRDYSVEQVRASFLQPHGINPSVIRVPPLEDAELADAEAAFPSLAIPLKSPALRNILRNPFVLDKALHIPWPTEKSLPQTERAFRALFWREIVRGGHRVAPATGRLREEALLAIAVRRAQALSPHVPVTGLDPAVVESLRGDSLITSPDDNPLLVAPAHDVLEDWAILQWLEERHLADASFKTLSDAIGTHPGVRRSYRKWVFELVDCDPANANRLLQAAVSETEISMQFRDDTLVSLLKAPSAPDLLARHETLLVANNRALLRRAIHLLRVACVKAPDWAAGPTPQGSIFNEPDGMAWPAVLRLVHRNLAAFADNERALLLGLVEDAVRGVSQWTPEVEGAEDVAGIAHWLLDGLLGYNHEEARKRVLRVIAKIPKADAMRFEAALRGQGKEGERRGVVAEDLRGLIFAGIEGMAAARDLPDLVISVGADYLLGSQVGIGDERHYADSSFDIELSFGVRRELWRSSFPPSAWRGPWHHLLRHHTEKALDLYIRVFNHRTDWHAHPRVRSRRESAWEVELTFADGGTRKQWTNAHLWGLYRGMPVGPDPLKSMLMALERWLLDVGQQEPTLLDDLLVDLLRRSDSASLAAVVASVATAYPHHAGEALLVLLSIRDYIILDRSRLVGERDLSGMAGMFPTFRADHQIYEIERKEANALPHRAQDLEAAIANLQLGPFAPRVHALLEMHLAALPPKEEQDEDDLLWRLAIHRMDLRQYAVSDSPGPEVPNRDAKLGEPQLRYVRLDPKPPAADLKAMLDRSDSRLETMGARFGVLMWGLHAFRRATGKYDASQWAERLAEAQAMDREVGAEDGSRHAPGLVAAVCIRDRWDDMTVEQRDWCIETACAEVLLHADDTDYILRLQKDSMAADRACASVLPLLLGRQLDTALIDGVKRALAAALTHSTEEVRWYAASSIDEGVWAADRGLALRCVSAIAAHAAIIAVAHDFEEGRPHDVRRDLSEIKAAASADVRARFWNDEASHKDAHVSVDFSSHSGAIALKYILVILGRVPLDPDAIAAFTRAGRTLVNWWVHDYDRRGGSNRDFQTESDVADRIEEFLLRTSPEAARQVLAPMLAVIDRHSRDLRSIMQGLTGLQDANPNTPQYWFLWELFADAVKRATWVAHLGKDRNPEGGDLLSAVFLTSYWRDDIRHWHSLDGYAHLVHSLFEALPPTSVVLDNYARFLYHIGERSLPAAFVHIAAALRRGDSQKMLARSNTVFMLEVLLQRHVYGRPLELKRDARIRDAVLFNLDCLVESGSSAAFRMRDDFVTPPA
ncbi:MAG TPA: AAA family ATPase [Thermoanaerobaculia bacterium]|nr:AAA family ATPase [Thermoanaerobaculia bacterium]